MENSTTKTIILSDLTKLYIDDFESTSIGFKVFNYLLTPLKFFIICFSLIFCLFYTFTLGGLLVALEYDLSTYGELSYLSYTTLTVDSILLIIVAYFGIRKIINRL